MTYNIPNWKHIAVGATVSFVALKVEIYNLQGLMMPIERRNM